MNTRIAYSSTENHRNAQVEITDLPKRQSEFFQNCLRIDSQTDTIIVRGMVSLTTTNLARKAETFGEN